MRENHAIKGEIPKVGEIWLPVGDKAHLMMVHLMDIVRVRPFIPEELNVKSVLPGKTLGLVFMTSMGPESTLPYHEFIIAPALAEAGGRTGFYVTHIYVDNEKSQIGGRRNFGLDKQMAVFQWDWESGKAGNIHIMQDQSPLFTVRYGRQIGKLRLQLGGGVFSVLDDKLIWCNNIFNAAFGFAKVEYEIPQGTYLHDDLCRMGLGRPIISVMGEKMKGFMGVDAQPAAFLQKK